jgi:hypothetical protein
MFKNLFRKKSCCVDCKCDTRLSALEALVEQNAKDIEDIKIQLVNLKVSVEQLSLIIKNKFI